MKILFLALVLSSGFGPASARADGPTSTPIRHLIVLFQENVSFDHYFATYPHAENLPGEIPFHALPGTPTVNGLTETLLLHNPNSAPPQRLDRAHAATCDQDHDYSAEQKAFDRGLMDKFVENTGDADSGCDRAVELRPAFRDERRLLRLDLRAVHAGRARPRLRPDARRGARGPDL
jgi:phospholipase C